MRLAIPISLVIAALLVGACDNSSAPSESAGTPGAASTEPSGGTETGTLVAFDARSGQELCRVEPPMRVVGGPIVAEGLVLVQGGTTCDFQKSIEGALVGYEAETGEERWRASAAGLCGGASAMSVSDGVAVVQDRETLRGLDVNTGEELWTAPFGLGTAELMRGSAGDIALVSDYGTWRAFDRQSGEQRWEMMAPIGTGTDPPPVVNATTAFFALYPSGTVAIDLATGAERWRASLGGETAGDRLVVSCTFDGSNMEDEAASKDKAPSTWVNTISAWDTDTGEELWNVGAENVACGDGPELTVVAVAPSNVYVLAGETLEALDAESGALRWQADAPAPSSASAAGGPFGLVTGDDEFVVVISERTTVAYDARSGERLWETPTLGSGPPSARVADGIVYLSGSGTPDWPEE